MFKSFTSMTSNLILRFLFSNKLAFTQVKNPAALAHFYESLGWKNDYSKIYLEKNMTITFNSIRAIVGSGHAIATYRSLALDNMSKKSSKYLLGGDSEKEYLDLPPFQSNFWRLTTNDNFAIHMGNSLEKSTEESFKNLYDESENVNFPTSDKFNPNTLWPKISKQLWKVLKIPLFYKLFLHYKGLTKQEVETF